MFNHKIVYIVYMIKTSDIVTILSHLLNVFTLKSKVNKERLCSV